MKRQAKRLICLLMTFVMVCTLLPTAALAANTVTVEKISTMDELVTGEYVLVASNGYAPGSWTVLG